ncbi:hypothetical protein BCR43DRAFT_497522 [Syncephalastrum racemosum]|uniref:F-box domain-containing protein n=1 Tax=Syncephalastrum racemosum TaxID=13706 RepID=A0A1X2H296_SYNRA|nr:hypothetical protein BCR43DRAFT_497522 [Syncephalastrum racemosum]
MDFEDEFNFFQTMTTAPARFPQETLTDVQGRPVNVTQLTENYRVIVVTLKSTVCPVCPQFLRILNLYGLDPDENRIIDPFTHQVMEISPDRKKFFRLLLKKDAYYIVVCPGPTEEVAEIQHKIPFPYPFIAGEQAMVLGDALKLRMSDTELWPAVLEIYKDSLMTERVSVGRAPGSYYQHDLLKTLMFERCRLEMRGVEAIAEARNLIDLLRRRLNNFCQGRLGNNDARIRSNRTLSLFEPASPVPQQEEREREQEQQQQQKEESPLSPWQTLPPEVTELVVSCAPTTKSLVRLARISRAFYIAAIHVLMERLRMSVGALRGALPQKEGQVISDEDEAVNYHLDRWHEDPEGVGYRQLARRVESLKQLISEVSRWSRHWNQRTKKVRAPIILQEYSR